MWDIRVPFALRFYMSAEIGSGSLAGMETIFSRPFRPKKEAGSRDPGLQPLLEI
jgi:hypothetical protein